MRSRHIYTAALSLVLGCGGGGGGGGGGDDDDRPDAGGDTDAGDDEEVTTGRCSVERAGPPAKVVFHDAAGAPLATVTTNDDGVAAYDDCVEGGMVTLVNPTFLGGGGGSVTRLFTVQGVGVGDHVLIDPPLEAAPTAGEMSITVQNGDDEASGGADSYQARVGDCMDTYLDLDDQHGGAIEVPDMTARCLGHDPDDFAVVSVALDAGDQPLALARVDSDDLDSPATASGGAWVAYDGPAQLALQNFPEGAGSGFIVVSPLIDDVHYSLDYQAFAPDEEVLEIEVWPDTIADAHRVSISAGFGDAVTSWTVTRDAGAPMTTVDFSTHLFQRPTQLVLDVSDPTRPVRRWNGGDDRAVLARSELAWTDGDDTGTWNLVAPGNAHELAVPLLPDDLGVAGPTATSLSVAGRMILVDKGIDYAEWLSRGLSSAHYGEDLDLQEFQEEAGVTIRSTQYWPD